MMRPLSFVLALAVCLPTLAFAQQPATYATLRADAERLYAEGSYARAREVYLQAKIANHPASEDRWIDLRLADTLWRSEAASANSDTTKIDAARDQLQTIVAATKREQDRDRVWAEANESLGDFWWVRRESRNWGVAWPFYQGALDWWAGARDVELARTRYIAIVWRASEPPRSEPYEYYGYYGNVLPTDVLENALKIATNANDRARAHYYLAITLQRTGDYAQLERVPGEFEAAISAGRSASWYDDSLFQYASFLASGGRAIYSEDGSWRREVDYAKALELYRRIVAEFKKGETRFYDDAVAQIDAITKPSIGVFVPNVFLPGSEVEYSLAWRNVTRIDLALYGVDLARDAALTNDRNDVSSWINEIPLAGRKPVQVWFKDTADKGNHVPGQERMRLGAPLKPGAYVLEARATGAAGAPPSTARDVVLVTDASIVVKTSGRQALAYVCGSADGAPIANARVALIEAVYTPSTSKWSWRRAEATANRDGIAVFDLQNDNNYRQLLVLAASEERQAFSYGQRNYYGSNEPPWRIYAYTDRPAYRPGEEAHWKLVARQYASGQYSTPAGKAIEYQITDPRGTKVAEGKATLNAFGSAWGSLALTESMPLGEYNVTFWTDGRNTTIGSATLLRLEEYKLPEFKVAIETPEEKGKKKAFRLGETVEVNVAADYYFGGTVANATVEVLVYQNPYYRYWFTPREYPWLYDQQPDRSYYGQGQIIKRETLKTDALGRAKLTFATPRASQSDFEYTIEARVTDASRREIVASDKVRVTRQRYFVDARPDRTLLRPADEARVKVKALDANDEPVAVSGTVKVTRDYWFEVWVDPKGKEVSGEELRKARSKTANFPPPTKPGDRGWTLKFQGYEHEDISTQTIQTDAAGQAEVKFTPVKEGYYKVAWASREPGGPPIQAEATVWALTSETTDLGYRTGGLQVLVDNDTLRAGETARVMLAAPTAGRFVLFSVEGDDLYSYQLVRMTGSVKLLEVPIDDKLVPNAFLSAAMVSDNQISVDTKEIVVPPVKNFLTVDVKSDREFYQPQEEGTITLTARDSDGRPVQAEVGLGLVDDSVYYIQSDYAGDPRQVYFGQKRYQRVSVQSSFQTKSYARLEREAQLTAKNERDGDDRRRQELGFFGDVGQRAAADAPAPPAAAATEATIVGGLAAGRAGKEQFKITETIAKLDKGPDGNQAPGQEPAVQVRSDFRSTVVWQPDVVTGPDGTATVKVRFPDSLTSWRATARAATAGNQFGIATSEARTRKPLTIRLQAPRFFVTGDSVTLSAIVNNNTETAMTVAPTLGVEGLDLKAAPAAAPVSIPPGGEHRFDWAAEARAPGAAKLTVTARGGSYADAMERGFTVYEHGVDKLVATSGKARDNDTVVTLDLPAARKPGTTKLDVQVSPSLATTMLDAVPYLIDYPYGCTEQTMSRFLPAAIVAKTLADQGLKPEDIEGRIFGGVEQATADATHPGGKRPVGQLAEVTKKSLERLYDFQHEDGGWGWWKDDQSDHYMSAYVVWGMTLAKRAGITVKDDVLERGVEYLNKELVEEEQNYDRQAWMLHALAVYHGGEDEPAGLEELAAFDNCFTHRDRLTAYTRALLALAAWEYKLDEQMTTLVRNLLNGAQVDTAPNASLVVPEVADPAAPPPPEVIATAHWGEERGWWRWSDGAIESTSFTLMALMTIAPKHELIEPAMNWLVKNRRGAQWSNTRDTAIAILALNDYLKKSGEAAADVEYEVLVNGTSVGTKALAARDAISAPNRIAVDPSLVRDGANEIRIVRKSGTGAIYFSAEARFFSTEEPIAPAANELFVRRQYFKLVGRPTLLKGFVYDRVPLRDGEEVKSGERIETVLTIETKNDYEYLLFEDLKPAGFEAVDIRSGESLYARELKSGAVEGARSGDPADYTDRQEWVYRELRDRKVALFVSNLPQGYWEIRYDVRAEAPGTFHALPVLGHAMYVPEIRGNGAETRVRVVDGP